jgi:hypothetical protein
VTRGFLYIATGESFVREAVISAKQIKEIMGECPIAIITEIDLNNPVFDHIIKINNASHDTGDQIKYMNKSPFDKTIYIDTDIYVSSDISSIFSILDQFDLAASLKQGEKYSGVTSDLPDSFPEYSTGMVAYNNNKTFDHFLANWKNIYRNHKSENIWENQPSFREAVYNSDIRISPLPREYHLFIRKPGYVEGEVKVAHGRLVEVGDSGGANKTVDVPSAIKELNKLESQRVYTHGLRGIRVSTNSRPYILKRAIKKRGYRTIINQILKKFRIS